MSPTVQALVGLVVSIGAMLVGPVVVTCVRSLIDSRFRWLKPVDARPGDRYLTVAGTPVATIGRVEQLSDGSCRWHFAEGFSSGRMHPRLRLLVRRETPGAGSRATR